MASRRSTVVRRVVASAPARSQAQTSSGMSGEVNESAQNVASQLSDQRGEPNQTASPPPMSAERPWRMLASQEEEEHSEFTTVRHRKSSRSDSETSNIARTHASGQESPKRSPITGPTTFRPSFDIGDETIRGYGELSEEDENPAPPEMTLEGPTVSQPGVSTAEETDWTHEKVLMSMWEYAQGLSKDRFVEEMHGKELDNNFHRPYLEIATREALREPESFRSRELRSPEYRRVHESDSELENFGERFSTAAKGKFKATELPPLTTGDGVVRFAPEPGSLEADRAALVEHDRLAALKVQEELDLEHAKRLGSAEDHASKRRVTRRMSVRSVTDSDYDGEPFKVLQRATTILETPKGVFSRRKSVERTPTKKPERKSVGEIIREGSLAPGMRPITSIPVSIPPSEQINPSTYLFAQMATPSKAKVAGPVPQPSRIVYPTGFGANPSKSTTQTTLVPTNVASTSAQAKATNTHQNAPPPVNPAINATQNATNVVQLPVNVAKPLANAPQPSDSSSSSSSDESSSSSSSSSSNGGRAKSGKRKRSKSSKNKKRRKEKEEQTHRAKIASALKLQAPEKWNGNANIDAFESWLFDVNLWYKNHAVPEDMRVSTLSNFLEGKARRTFMSIVSPEIESWTQEQVVRLFFDELFPSNIMEQLRDRFAKSYQGTLSVRAWAQRIRDLAKPVGDISDKEKTRQFWDGARPSIRIEWCREGYSREQSTFELLREAAERIERKEQQMKIERDKTESRTIRTASITKTHAKSNKPRQNESKDRKGKTQHDRKSKLASTGGRKPDYHSSKQQTPRRLTPEEMEEHRAKGQCFNCHETGHRANDCPKRNQLKAPKLLAGSVTFDKIDSQVKDVTNLMLGSINLLPVTELDENTVSCRNLGVQIWAEGELETRLRNIPLSHEQMGFEGDRFVVTPWTESPGIFSVSDILLGLEWSFTAIDLFDEEFDICESYYEYVDAKKQEWAHLLEQEPNSQDWKNVFKTLEQNVNNSTTTESDGLPELIAVSTDADDQEDLAGCPSETPISHESVETTASVGSTYARLRDALTSYIPHIDDSNTSSERQSACSDSDVADSADLPFRERMIRALARVSRKKDSLEDSEEEDNPLTTAEGDQLQAHMVDETNQRSYRSKKRQPQAVLERNAAKTRDFERCTPKPCVLDGFINGNPVRMLVDSGSMADFISTTLVDQLKLPYDNLENPLSVQLAVRGSRGKINASTSVKMQYEGINETRRFDVMNIDSYDVILGTPFLFQHQGLVGFNPTRFAFESAKSLPIVGDDTARISSRTAQLLEENLEKVRTLMKKEAADLCKPAEETPLPPYRVVNHRIPLKDESIQMPYIPSRCPQAFQAQWDKKRDTYLRTGRWRYATGSSAVPMLFIPKKPGPDGEKRLRTVFAKQRLNQNTTKLSSPLPDIQTILETVAPYTHKSLIDGRDAYEQIRVEKDDVWKTLFNTPDGTMVSEVMQQGDCNAGATYQTLMNSLFASYIGKFMFVYLDDIIIFSNSVGEHIEHIRIVLDVLRRDKLYLTSIEKLQFFARPLKVLGHVIDERGILMDPHKVDRIENWKTPTNADQVAAFTGMVQYLARDCHGVAIPLAVLSKLQGNKVWAWGATEQRAFEEVKRIVCNWRANRRETADRSDKADPIAVHVDASLTGAGGVIWQGETFATGRILAFWSGKFNPAEQNYPTHDRELLGIVTTLKRYAHILYGTKFTVYSDHEPFEALFKQKSLNARQKRWLEELSHFDFEISYVPGEENGIADGLSRIYSNEPRGIVRTDSEFVTRPMSEKEANATEDLIRGRMARSKPLYTGKPVQAQLAALAITRRQLATDKDQTVGPTVEGDAPRAKPSEQPKTVETTAKRPTIARGLSPESEENSDESDEDEKRQKDAPATVIQTDTRPKQPSRRRELSPESEENSNSDEEPASMRNAKTSAVEPNQQIRKHNSVPQSGGREAQELATANETRQIGRNESAVTAEADRLATKDRESRELDLPEVSPNLTYLVNQSEQGFSLPGCLRGQYENDDFFAPIVKNPIGYNHFALDDGLLYHKTDGRRVLCVPDVEISGRKVREMLITHAHSILAHLGSEKTLNYLRENVWWKGMTKDISEYCTSCTTCAHAKAVPTKPFGLLKVLEVPTRPWEAIGMDFVGPLPSSANRDSSYDMICTIIDHLTSMVHLVPMRQTYTAKDVAELVFEEVYKLHGLPERIISDRDSYFTSTFWKELHRLIGVELRLSTSFHPQTDGATERANRTMTTMLRQAVSDHQKDWATKLPAIEFAMNLARSVSTGYSPFFLNYGQMPRAMLTTDETVYPGVRKRALAIREAILSAHDAILSARVKQTTEANKHRRPAPFAEGDLVYLSTKNLSIPKGRARKLVPKYIGPFKILKVIVPGASFRLELPAELKQRGLHSVFHASLLRIHVPNDDRKFPGRTYEHVAGFGKPSEWPVERILSHEGRGKRAIFEVLWKSGDKSWEMFSTIKALSALDRYLEVQGVQTTEELADGEGKTPNDPQIRVAAMAIKPGRTSASSKHTPPFHSSMPQASMTAEETLAAFVDQTTEIPVEDHVDDETLVVIPQTTALIPRKLRPVLKGEFDLVKQRIADLEKAVEKLKAKGNCKPSMFSGNLSYFSNQKRAPKVTEPVIKAEPIEALLPPLGTSPQTPVQTSQNTRRKRVKVEDQSVDGDTVMHGPESEFEMPHTPRKPYNRHPTPYQGWAPPFVPNYRPRGRPYVPHAYQRTGGHPHSYKEHPGMYYAHAH